MLTGCTKGTGGSAFGPPLLSMSHVDVLTLTVSLYIIKCERRLEMGSFFRLWCHQDESGLGILEPLKMRTWQDLSSLKGVLLGRQERGGQCLVDSVFQLLFAVVSYWGFRTGVEGGGGRWGYGIGRAGSGQVNWSSERCNLCQLPLRFTA